MRPSVQRTCCSLTHAPRTFRSVFADLARPCWIASSKLFVDVALISDTLATDIYVLLPHVFAGAEAPALQRGLKASLYTRTVADTISKCSAGASAFAKATALRHAQGRRELVERRRTSHPPRQGCNSSHALRPALQRGLKASLYTR